MNPSTPDPTGMHPFTFEEGRALFIDPSAMPELILEGLAGNNRQELLHAQEAILAHIGYFQMFYWALWIGTLLFLFVRFVIIPTLRIVR